jgi:hypothetical protein
MESGEMSYGDSDKGAIMPPRGLRWLIVMFWLTTTGWLLWRDLWPSWRHLLFLSGEPPPYHIDDVAEVHKGNQPKTNWTVQRGKVGEAHPDKVFVAKTWLDYHKDEDTYSLHAELNASKTLKLQPFYVADILKIDKMTSEYRITRAGRLHSLKAEVQATPHFDRRGGKVLSLLGSLLQKQSAKAPENSSSSQSVSLRLWGEVRDDQFFGHCCASIEEDPCKPIDLPPTAVSYTGSVLMPLHPVNQISGLRPGQSWRQPLVDPLRDAFASVPGLSGGVRFLNAHVLPQAEMLEWGDSETSCLVIEYTDDENETRGRTWVEQDSNRVLQQEAILDDGRWLMKRQSPRRQSKSLLDE